MDAKKFDDVTRLLGSSMGRRGLLKGTAGAALAGVVTAARVGRAGAQEKVKCNSDEKCEAKCGREDAVCCRAKGSRDAYCIRGCGPNRVLNQRCQCVRVTDSGTYKTGPYFCGA